MALLDLDFFLVEQFDGESNRKIGAAWKSHDDTPNVLETDLKILLQFEAKPQCPFGSFTFVIRQQIRLRLL